MKELIAAELEAMQRALAPAAAGPVTFRVVLSEEQGKAIVLIHVFDAYDCKGTEAEVAGLLADCPLAWRIVWH